MALEIERKFLVKANSRSWMKHASASNIRQGYLCDDVRRSVRVRINEQAAFLTIKGQTVGMSRHEYEYAIPVDDADITSTFVEKLKQLQDSLGDIHDTFIQAASSQTVAKGSKNTAHFSITTTSNGSHSRGQKIANHHPTHGVLSY
jgi:CYTH domain-containing protein